MTREEQPKIRILLVDSQQAFLNIATDFFRRHDELVLVGTASGRKEALAQAQDLQPQVILMDFDHLLGPGGRETIPRLRILAPDVTVIVMALLGVEAYRQAALTAGADDFVSKYNLTTDLLPAVRRARQAPALG
jgi:DNA-binding NarL/FixJ family response regulator